MGKSPPTAVQVMGGTGHSRVKLNAKIHVMPNIHADDRRNESGSAPSLLIVPFIDKVNLSQERRRLHGTVFV